MENKKKTIIFHLLSQNTKPKEVPSVYKKFSAINHINHHSDWKHTLRLYVRVDNQLKVTNSLQDFFKSEGCTFYVSYLEIVYIQKFHLKSMNHSEALKIQWKTQYIYLRFASLSVTVDLTKLQHHLHDVQKQRQKLFKKLLLMIWKQE